MGERFVQNGGGRVAKATIQRQSRFIPSLEISTSLNCDLNKKSRMKRDFQVRFCENVRVRFLCVTRLPASIADDTTHKQKQQFDR